MAGKELAISAATGLTVYAVIRNPANQVWNTSLMAFEAYNAAHWPTVYAVALAEDAGSGDYAGDFPTGIVAAGLYRVYVRIQSGGSPATTDAKLGTGQVNWDGAKEIGIPDVNARTTLALPNVAAGAAGGLPTATDSSGRVTTDVSATVTTNLNATVSSRATPAQLLANPSVPIANNSTTGAVVRDLTQVLPTPRDMSAVADSATTAADAEWAALSEAYGQQDQPTTTSWRKKTGAGTVTRTFTTAPSNSAPTSRV